MRLALSSLVFLIYIAASLIWSLPCSPFFKIVVALIFLFISLKYLMYIKIGGSFIAPDLPCLLLLAMEILYSAMIILVFLLLVKDALSLLLLLCRSLGGTWHLPLPPARLSIAILITALLLSLYGTWQALRVPEVHSIEIALPGLQKNLDGFIIAQLTDLHIGPFLKGWWLKEVVARTNALSADLIVLTGDMIDGSITALKNEVAPLGDLKAQYGVYGVTGNHEYYFDAERWSTEFSAMGIVMLNNDYRIISRDGSNLILLGVTDRSARRSTGSGSPIDTLGTLLHKLPPGVRVLLQHRPSGASANMGVDLQLSGHTHGGHLFFLKWLIAAFNRGLVDGLFAIDSMQLYVSPGTGIWAGFSCRLGVASEITRIILRCPENG